MSAVDITEGAPEDLPSDFVHTVPIMPGELLCSWVARQAGRNLKTFPSGKARGVVWCYIGDSFKFVHSTLDTIHHISAGELIRRFTPLGINRPFSKRHDWEELVSNVESGIKNQMGRKAQHSEGWIKICPNCRAQEAVKGIKTWTVAANLPRVRYCGHCKHPLVARRIERKKLQRPSDKDIENGTSLAVDGPEVQHHQLFAADMNSLLRIEPLEDPRIIQRAYRYLLRQNSRRPTVPDLVKVVEAFFGQRFLKQLELDETRLASVLHPALKSTQRRPTAVGCVLAARALGTSIAEVFKTAALAPNDAEGWPCPNLHGGCGNRRTIHDYVVKDRVVEMRCPRCKISFRRSLASLAGGGGKIHFTQPSASTVTKIVQLWKNYDGRPEKIARHLKVRTELVYGAAMAKEMAPAKGSERQLAEELAKEIARLRDTIASNPGVAGSEIRNIFGRPAFRKLRHSNRPEFHEVYAVCIKRRTFAVSTAVGVDGDPTRKRKQPKN